MFPIRKIVLFKHGVGYFERQKTVTDNAPVDLFFKSSQVNDVLKSLTAIDLGGTVSSVSYQAQTPVHKQLEQLSLRLDYNTGNALTNLLEQGVGAEVTIIRQGDDSPIVGVVVCVEHHLTPEGKSAGKKVNVLVEGKTIRTIPVAEIDKFTFSDPNLRQDLAHLLEIHANAKKQDLKKLTIFCHGSGKRNVVASYVIGSPVWRTSYRILLSPKQSFIQGWCLIDNTQDEDWQDVELRLVSGRPNAFTHDLYTPRFRTRPVVAAQRDAESNLPSLQDVLPNHSQSLLKDASPLLSSLSVGEQIGTVTQPQEKGLAFPHATPNMAHFNKQGEIDKSSVRHVKEVDSFAYDIKQPVTVRRGQSALVPFLLEPIAGTSCTLFNAKVNPNNPLTVILFKNNLNMTLDGGPITIFDQNTCLGEAMLETTRHGDEKFIPFAIERGVEPSIKTKSGTTPAHSVTLENGTLSMKKFKFHITEYAFHNKAPQDCAKFYIEHQIQPDGELVDTDPPVSKTKNFYRFSITVCADSTTKFVVTERTPWVETKSIENCQPREINEFLELHCIDQKTHDYLLSEFLPRELNAYETGQKLFQSSSEIRGLKSELEQICNSLHNVTSRDQLSEGEELLAKKGLSELVEKERELGKLQAMVRESEELHTKLLAEMKEKKEALKYQADIFTPPPAVHVQGQSQ